MNSLLYILYRTGRRKNLARSNKKARNPKVKTSRGNRKIKARKRRPAKQEYVN